jgi:peptide-methionine (R)-S-oxide reductase
MPILSRRDILAGGIGVVGLTLFTGRGVMAKTENFSVVKTDAEWLAQLTPDQYEVLRRHGTEPAHTSPLNDEHRQGVYQCAGCDLPLYDAKTKYHSGTGWPSFYDHLPNAIGTTTDFKLILPRTEVHCSRCGGHLGHVFEDGPQPTGLRYCMNGVALQFVAEKA